MIKVLTTDSHGVHIDTFSKNCSFNIENQLLLIFDEKSKVIAIYNKEAWLKIKRVETND